MNSGHAVVLMSGGIDSAATVAACSGEYATLSGLFIDYGQPARKSEWEAAQGIAGYFGINITKSDIGLRMTPRHGEYFGRNALLLLAAASSHAFRPLTVALGIHSMCPYYDTTPLFTRHMQQILHGYSGGEVTLSAPFLSYTKREVIRYARDSGVPLEVTYSCEVQDAPSCGHCPSCLDRSDLHAEW